MLGWSVLSLFVWWAMLAGYVVFFESDMPDTQPELDEPVDFELVLPDIPKPVPPMVDVDTPKQIKQDKKSVFDPSLYLQQKNLKIEKEEKTEVIQQDVLEDVVEPVIDIPIPKILPESVRLDLTFWPQAPDGDRNQPRQDACEEASIILPAYRLNKKSLTKQQFTQEILNLVSLQNEMFGSYVDTTVAQTQQLYNTYYGIGTTKILENPTSDQLREELAAWRPIVAPFAGKMLGNPYYSNGGPRYHMMTIVWYDADHFVVHDVGTRHGAFYLYRTEVIMDALHDFVPVSQWSMTDGARRVLVVSRDEI